jgi:hypothetical protein
MRYVAVDVKSLSRESFDGLKDLREWVGAIRDKHPDMPRRLLVTTYDAAGREVWDSWAEDLLAAAFLTREVIVRDGAESRAATSQDLMPGLEVLSGTALPSLGESFHRYVVAKGTLAQVEGESVLV